MGGDNGTGGVLVQVRERVSVWVRIRVLGWRRNRRRNGGRWSSRGCVMPRDGQDWERPCLDDMEVWGMDFVRAWR